MSKIIDVQALEDVMKSIAAIQFSLLFGSGRNGRLPKNDSDIDVAVMSRILMSDCTFWGLFRIPSRRSELIWSF
jgi:hypothetical protein